MDACGEPLPQLTSGFDTNKLAKTRLTAEAISRLSPLGMARRKPFWRAIDGGFCMIGHTSHIVLTIGLLLPASLILTASATGF